MNSIFLDTNVILDLIEDRKPFSLYAQYIFSRKEANEVILYTSSLNFANMHYIISKKTNKDTALKTLIKLKTLISLLPLTDKIIELSLASNFKDFEDAIQYFTAIENGINTIITRDIKDFKKAKINVLSSKQYFEMM